MPAAWIALTCALWVAVIVLAIVTIGLLRRVAALESSGSVAPGGRGKPPSPGLALGDHPPVVAGFEQLTAAPAAPGGRLVLFLSSSCGACKRLASSLADRQAASDRLTGDGVELVLVSDPAGEQTFANLQADETVVEDHRQLSSAWRVPGTPFVVALDHAGVMRAAGFTTTAEQLDKLAAVDTPDGGLSAAGFAGAAPSAGSWEQAAGPE